jgi:hypothetical protein
MMEAGYSIKDIMDRMDKHFEVLSEEIKHNREISDRMDDKQNLVLQRIEDHVKNTNGKVAKNLKEIAELQTTKADNSELQTVRKYSVGNYARDHPGKFISFLTGGSGLSYVLIEWIKKIL